MLLQVRRVSTVISHTKMQWENAIEKFKNVIQVWVWVQVWTRKKQCSELDRQTWSSGHRKCIRTAIKHYTRCSNAQRVMEQKDLLI